MLDVNVGERVKVDYRPVGSWVYRRYTGTVHSVSATNVVLSDVAESGSNWRTLSVNGKTRLLSRKG